MHADAWPSWQTEKGRSMKSLHTTHSSSSRKLAMAGVDLAYNVVVPEDCIAGSDQKVHDMIIAEQMRLLAHISSAQAVTEALAARA